MVAAARAEARAAEATEEATSEAVREAAAMEAAAANARAACGHAGCGHAGCGHGGGGSGRRTCNSKSRNRNRSRHRRLHSTSAVRGGLKRGRAHHQHRRLGPWSRGQRHAAAPLQHRSTCSTTHSRWPPRGTRRAISSAAQSSGCQGCGGSARSPAAIARGEPPPSKAGEEGCWHWISEQHDEEIQEEQRRQVYDGAAAPPSHSRWQRFEGDSSRASARRRRCWRHMCVCARALA